MRVLDWLRETLRRWRLVRRADELERRHDYVVNATGHSFRTVHAAITTHRGTCGRCGVIVDSSHPSVERFVIGDLERPACAWCVPVLRAQGRKPLQREKAI